MKIGNFDTDKQVFVIAEIGNNHEGSYTLAEELIGRAAEAGTDAVKFQSIIPEKLASSRDVDRIAQLRRFQLSPEQMEKLKCIADREGVLFLSTPFSLESVIFLNNLVPAFKVASGDNNFYPLLAAVAKTGKPVLLSTGMADFAKIKETIAFLQRTWNDYGIPPASLAVLHCVVSYPTPPAEANLSAIRTLQNLGMTVGYSDHTLGIEAAVLACALGARIIEKHFTIDKTYSTFRDHQLSADPAELKEMVARIKAAQVLMGDGEKRVMGCERESLPRVRRTIVAGRRLTEGDIIAWEDLNWVRLGHGLAPGCEGSLIGRRVRAAIDEGDAILPENLEVAE
ncbi:MAG: Sialic acid synthase [Nitrospirae bacterium]|nr:MAG: Sialic acid synthase [Nitrospirota bacterium]